MQFDESNSFVEMLQFTREFIEGGLLIDKNPPKDVLLFLDLLDELENTAKQVTNNEDWDNFFVEYHEDIKNVLAFGDAMIAARNMSIDQGLRSLRF